MVTVNIWEIKKKSLINNYENASQNFITYATYQQKAGVIIYEEYDRKIMHSKIRVEYTVSESILKQAVFRISYEKRGISPM